MGLSSPFHRSLRTAFTIVLIVFGIIFVLPMVWVVLASVDGQASLEVAWPKAPTLANFGSVLTPDIAFVPVWNSLVLSGGTAVVAVVLATLAAYPLSRFRSRFNKAFLLVVLFCLLYTSPSPRDGLLSRMPSSA